MITEATHDRLWQACEELFGHPRHTDHRGWAWEIYKLPNMVVVTPSDEPTRIRIVGRNWIIFWVKDRIRYSGNVDHLEQDVMEALLRL